MRALPALKAVLVSLWFLGFLFMLSAEAVFGGEDDLRDEHDEILKRIKDSSIDEPLELESSEENNHVHGEIYGLVEYGFDKFADAFKSASNWCEVIFLHPNVKACVAAELDNGSATLRVHMGSKHSQTLEEAMVMNLTFRMLARKDGYLETELAGEEGPYGTRNVRMEMEAIPSSKERTLLRFFYSLEIGGATRVTMDFYLSTVGGDKVGFSKTKDNDELVGGQRGMIERNVMRFYLALQAYLDTLDKPEGERLQARLERWFDLTNRYPEQLGELDREIYLSQKMRKMQEE